MGSSIYTLQTWKDMEQNMQECKISTVSYIISTWKQYLVATYALDSYIANVCDIKLSICNDLN